MNKPEITHVLKRRHGEGGIDCRGENKYRLRYRIGRMRISETFNGKLSDAAHQLRMIIAASNAQNYREAQSRQSIADDTWAIGRLKDGLEIIPDNYEKMINLLEQICISISLDCSIRGLAKEFGLSVRQAQNFTRCFKKFNPEVIKAVSTVHKKWKVAYDALSETGINIGG